MTRLTLQAAFGELHAKFMREFGERVRCILGRCSGVSCSERPCDLHCMHEYNCALLCMHECMKIETSSSSHGSQLQLERDLCAAREEASFWGGKLRRCQRELLQRHVGGHRSP